MLEFAVIALYIGALLAAATHAFMRPNGIYWRSAAGVGVVIALATAIWWLGSPVISNETGFGAFAIWCAVVALATLVAAAACLAATLRHLLNALGARLI